MSEGNFDTEVKHSARYLQELNLLKTLGREEYQKLYVTRTDKIRSNTFKKNKYRRLVYIVRNMEKILKEYDIQFTPKII